MCVSLLRTSAPAAKSYLTTLPVAWAIAKWRCTGLRVLRGNQSCVPPSSLCPYWQVPSGDLACRLDILLNGVARLLGRDPALRYIHKAVRLRLMLAEPEASVQLLQDRYDAYVEVVGVPPRPELLAASESSHMRGPVQTFRKKLERFVQQ